MTKLTTKVKSKLKTKALNKALVSRSKNGGDGKNLLKSYHIETFDEGAYLNFFTEAKNKTGALRNLLKNSWDFKNLTNDKREWRITIKELK